MEIFKKKETVEISNLFQELYGSYYLIPNIERYLNKVFAAINKEFSLIASSAYYTPLGKEKITLINNFKYNKIHSGEEILNLFKKIITENYNIILGKKKIFLNKSVMAYVMPIFYESKNIALLTLFNDKNSLILNESILDYIEIYISVAIVANYLITKKEDELNSLLGSLFKIDVSIKTILEWRLQEIMDNFLQFPLNDRSIFKEISLETERIMLKAALTKTNDNKTQAANLLGLNRNTFRRKLKDLNLT